MLIIISKAQCTQHSGSSGADHYLHQFKWQTAVVAAGHISCCQLTLNTLVPWLHAKIKLACCRVKLLPANWCLYSAKDCVWSPTQPLYNHKWTRYFIGSTTNLLFVVDCFTSNSHSHNCLNLHTNKVSH